MQCPKCRYMMDAFDKECPRCHGKGISFDKDEEEEHTGGAPIQGRTHKTVTPSTGQIAVAPNTDTDTDDGINVYETFIGSVVGRWSSIFIGCTREAAWKFGISCAVVSILCIAIGIGISLHKMAELLSPLSSLGNFAGEEASIDSGSSFSTEQILNLLVVAFLPFISISISSAIMRKLFSHSDDGSFADDVFIAGVSLLPLSGYALIGSYLGLANFEVAIILLIFALSYTLILLYNGYTIVGHIKSTAAALAVPTTLLLSTWITKIIFTKVIGL